MYLNTSKLGWRVRTLRQRHGIGMTEVSERTGIDPSYISRLERDSLQNARPKPETIDKVLMAIDVTPIERNAVYHIEQPDLAQAEIDAQVRLVAALQEDATEPAELSDERWFVHYYNRAARAALGLSADEYRRVVGTHMLHAPIDPANPLFSRVPNDDRAAVFALRARMFQVAFAAQEFDDWYNSVIERVYDFPWAVEIWERPPCDAPSLFIERQDFTILNPVVGYMMMRFQINHLMAHPRFLLSNWTFLNTATAIQLAVLRTRPEYAYSYQAAVSPVGDYRPGPSSLALF